jgi:hypothetical protein
MGITHRFALKIMNFKIFNNNTNENFFVPFPALLMSYTSDSEVKNILDQNILQDIIILLYNLYNLMN